MAILFCSEQPRATFLGFDSMTVESDYREILKRSNLVHGCDTTFSIHANAIVLPERTLAIQVNLETPQLTLARKWKWHRSPESI
jgi:hypothetical protein